MRGTAESTIPAGSLLGGALLGVLVGLLTLWLPLYVLLPLGMSTLGPALGLVVIGASVVLALSASSHKRTLLGLALGLAGMGVLYLALLWFVLTTVGT